jgi:hypothetical protein
MKLVPKVAIGLGLLFLLALPTAAVGAGPGNDNRANATPIDVPSTASGSTAGATTEPTDPRGYCGNTDGNVWYRLSGAEPGRLVLRFSAGGDLDAFVAVYRVVRSQLGGQACGGTDAQGRAALSFVAERGATYLIEVARLVGSADGPFQFRLFRPEPSSRPPGTPLPRRGVRSSVDALSDFDDAWSLRMQPGIAYKMNLVPARSRCVTLSIFKPGTRVFAGSQPIHTLRCGGYFMYTPGPRGAGRYSLLVTANGTRPGPQRYRLQAALAGPDDMSPGFPIRNLQTRRGSLSASGIDVVDLYRFQVADRSDVTLSLRAPDSFSLVLLSETGRRLESSSGSDSLTKRLSPGRFFAVVRARGFGGGRYRLSLLERRLTTTTVLVDGERVATVTPGRSVSIGVAVELSPAGVVKVQIDRFDPLTGWNFHRLFTLRLGADGRTGLTWRPPAIGRWRVRALFRGTRTASPSRGRAATVVVAEPST